MLLTVKKEITEEIEVGEFPIFTHTPPFYYKILSLKEALRVTLSPFGNAVAAEILEHEIIISDQLGKGNRIEENEFVDAFVKTVHSLNDLVKEPEVVEQQLSIAS